MARALTLLVSLAAAALAVPLATPAAAGGFWASNPLEREPRSIDGSGSNREDPQMGAAHTPLLRLFEAAYADGVSALAGPERPSPRAISNAASHQHGRSPIDRRVSDYFWQWGQFLDHDIDLTGPAEPSEPQDVPVPPGDPFFDPDGHGTAIIPFDRSIYDPTSGTGPDNPREQQNEITAWIDASNVYGSDPLRASALRTHDDTGRLATSPGRLLPFNTDGLPNVGGPDPGLFLAGDVRANEQVGLTALHTLFVREHNRLARSLRRRHPHLSGEKIYQRARRIVIAEMQVITYQEFLPVLLGPNALAPYRGYDRSVDARIANEFSTAAYRFGHSALSAKLMRLDRKLRETPAGHLALRDAFFAPQRITDEGGIEPLLRGLAWQVCQQVDVRVIDDVRNFLFGRPDSGGFDLVALNLQRGRDHGLPSYNAARVALGLPAAQDFADISSDPDVQARLDAAYAHVDDIDLWIGGLAEDHVSGAKVGPTYHAILVDQFEALRDGDRFWYTRTLGGKQRHAVERTRLSHIIRRNTKIGGEIPVDVFHVRLKHARGGD
jgi:hypothetical protein